MLLSRRPRAETANGALVKAYLNNPDINTQRAAVRVADENVPKVNAGYLPTVTGQANVGLERADNDRFGANAVASLGIGHLDFLLPHWHWDTPPPRPNGDPIEYGRWFWEIYKAWTADKHAGVEVRFLANIVSQLAGGASIYEAMTLAPVTLVVVAADGSIEAVDSIKSTASGLQHTGLNVHASTFDMVLDARLVSIRQSGEDQLCEQCRQCRFKKECAGGYFPHRWGRGRQFDNPSVYCADLYWLISQIYEDLAARRRKRETLHNCPPE